MSKAETGQRQREAAAQRSRDRSVAVADIGEIPPVANPRRRARCIRSLSLFLRTYFPHSTGLKPFSAKHDEAIRRLQLSILDGGRFLNLFPRGFAKTTIGENAALWATLCGHRKFVPLVGAEDKLAKASLESLSAELCENDLLYADFPEVCHAFRALEGKPQRCRSQTHAGELTHIRLTAEEIVLPTVAGSVASGAIIVTRSLGSSIRGLKYKRPDGTQQRPDFVIIDDPQTDESAASPSQTAKRLRTIRRTILRLGGHQRRIAVVINATMIEEGDLVAQLLADPAWQSMRVKMVEKWADAHESFWLSEYADCRRTFDPENPDDQARAHRDATALYRRNRRMADAGAVVTWRHCYEEGELSALQHAYNILIDDGPDVFASECQNEPLPKVDDPTALTAKQISEKLSGVPRGRVPIEGLKLTATIDVQQEALFWAVCSWGENFTGNVIDYGVFPEQRRPYFTLSTLNPTLAATYPRTGVEGAMTAGLNDLIERLLNRQFRRDDEAEMPISLCLVDEGFKTSVVHSVISRSRYRSILLPSKGMAERVSHKVPFAEYKRKPGERTGGGYPWRIKPSEMTRGLRHILFEPNWWKTFIHSRFAVAAGDPGCLSLFGRDAHVHRLIADHCTAEFKTRTKNEDTGKTMDEWQLPPHKPDNHWFDTLVGCAVAASVEGVQIASVEAARPKRPRQVITQADVYNRVRI